MFLISLLEKFLLVTWNVDPHNRACYNLSREPATNRSLILTSRVNYFWA